MVDETAPLIEVTSGELTGWSVLDAMEIPHVEQCVALASTPRARTLAAAATRVGNGWLYLFVTLLLIPARGEQILRCAATAGLSMAATLAVYPLLKRLARRLRPYELRPRLRCEVRALDRYSFPSGHAMTAAACGVPFLFVYSFAAAVVVIPVWALISWSRLALGHHYPSDVLAGALLGAAVACTVISLI